MAKKREPLQKLYGTKQVAEILGIPEWRVKNFSEGEAYRLPPAQTVGSGRGSRRLYEEIDVMRIAIANELVTCGFTPEAVGKAVLEITPSKLTKWAESMEDGEDEKKPLLVYAHGEWQVESVFDATERMRSDLDDAPYSYPRGSDGIFILNFPQVLIAVLKRMKGQHEVESKDGGKR